MCVDFYGPNLFGSYFMSVEDDNLFGLVLLLLQEAGSMCQRAEDATDTGKLVQVLEGSGEWAKHGGKGQNREVIGIVRSTG